jgi:hypothetical protein
MTDSNERGYVYEPGVESTTSPAEREFDWKGWTLVGTIVFAFLVAPAIILFHPPDMLPFFVAYLVLPLLPAVLLGFVAVWVTARP